LVLPAETTGRSVIFDWDGTLVDNSLRQYRCFCDVLEQRGLQPTLSFVEFWEQRRGGRRIRDCFPSTLPPAAIRESEAAWISNVESPRLLSLDRLYPGAQECLRLICQTCSVFLCSLRQDPAALRVQLRHLNVADFFIDVFVGSPLGRRSKSDLIQPVLRSASVRPAIVGDSEIEVLTGREAGIHTVAVTYGNRSREFLTPFQPDIIVDRIEEVPAALGLETI